MNSFLARLLPIVILFVLGVVLRRFRVFDEADARRFLHLVLYVALPAYSTLSVWRVTLQAGMLLLPVYAVIMVVASSGIAWLVGRALRLPRRTQGVFVIGSSIMNIAFAIPFVTAGFGEEGYARLAVFNFGNGLMVFSYAYWIAVRYGQQGGLGIGVLWKVLALPPVWGLGLGIVLNLLHAQQPPVVMETLELAAAMTVPLIMLALGIQFRPKREKMGLVLLALFMRTGVGLLLGWLVVLVFGLHGMLRAIVLISSVAPVGFNTVVFATLEDLDTPFAANLVSISLLLGMVYMPLLVYLLG